MNFVYQILKYINQNKTFFSITLLYFSIKFFRWLIYLSIYEFILVIYFKNSIIGLCFNSDYICPQWYRYSTAPFNWLISYTTIFHFTDIDFSPFSEFIRI